MVKGMSNKKYIAEFKQMVVETMHKEGLSCWEADRKFGLPQRRAQTWKRIYLEEGSEGLAIERRGRKSVDSPQKLSKEV